MTQISFNGKTYNSLEEMPAAEREAYQQIARIFVDENRNGVPDIFEGNLMKNMMSFAKSAMVMHGGQAYTLQNMPPEVRAKYDEAMVKLEQMGLIQPGMLPTQEVSASKVSTPSYPTTPAISGAQGAPSVMEEDTGPNWAGIVVGTVVVLLVCAAAAVVLVMLNAN